MKNFISISLLSTIALTIVYTVKNKSSGTYHDEYIHKVISVRDGDTITVSPGVEGEHHIRYLGMDTPEYNEPFGKQAADFNRKLVGNKKVKIKTTCQKLGFYMRILGLVYVQNNTNKTPEELFVNELILREGLAWIYPGNILNTDLRDLFVAAQNDAIKNKKNIWARLKLDMLVYEEQESPIFHANAKCTTKAKKENPIKAIDAFQKILLPCKRCRRELWNNK